jgi:hypothetical protein
MLHPSCMHICIQHTTYNIQHTTYNIQHTTYNTRPLCYPHSLTPTPSFSTLLPLQFENIISELLEAQPDPQLLQIVKAHDWTGTRFKPKPMAKRPKSKQTQSAHSPHGRDAHSRDTHKPPQGIGVEMHSLLRDLSNLYLRRSRGDTGQIEFYGVKVTATTSASVCNMYTHIQ